MVTENQTVNIIIIKKTVFIIQTNVYGMQILNNVLINTVVMLMKKNVKAIFIVIGMIVVKIVNSNLL